MQDIDLLACHQRKIADAEIEFEATKAELFGPTLPREQFAVRRAYARELERALSRMHEIRRQLFELGARIQLSPRHWS